MGRNGQPEAPSEAKRAANALNAKKPRRKFTADLRARAHAILSPALAGPGMRYIRQIIVDGPSGDRYERFRWAIEFVASRVGLPAVMRQEHEDVTPGREVVVLSKRIPWLEASTDASADGDHDGRAERSALQ